MAGAIGKYAAQKFLKSHMKKYQSKKVDGGDDPFFAMIEDPKRPGKFKKVKKQIPAYIPDHDALILAKYKKQAYRLDMCLFSLFGVRFGWESVIGLIPFAGDAIGAALAMTLVRKSMKVDGGLPQSVLIMMVINIALDFIVGLIPFIGDLADAAFKCNTRNVKLLEQHLDKKYKPSTSGRDERDFVGTSKEKRRQDRKSGIYHPRDPPPATVFEDFSDEEDERRQFVADGRAADARVAQPQPTAGIDARTNAPGQYPSGGRREETR